MRTKHLAGALLIGMISAASSSASAEDELPSSKSDWLSNLGGLNLTIGGFIRSETAFTTSNGKLNPFNQNGDPYNGVATPRNGAFADTTTRSGVNQTQVVNLQLFRGELETKLRLSSSFSAVARVRAVFDPAFYAEYDSNGVNSQAAGRLNGRPDYFQYDVEGSARGQPLEWSGRQYLIDLPALVLEYSNDALSIRAGVQQIAWGQAIFFRVLDVPDGLDFRRHSVLDLASEEFSDKRVSAPAVRVTYSFDDHWMGDAYVQKFQPSVYSNPNTPYNVIASQFTVHDQYAKFDDKVDAGFRVKGDFGGVGVQAIYAHRYNPEGVFRWTASGVNRDLPGLVGSGAAMQGTPLEVDSTGVWSGDEWFHYAGLARLNGVSALNAIVNEFQPFTGALGAMPVTDYAGAHQTLDSFFQLAGGALVGTNNAGLRGHIARDYRREDDIGFGASHIFDGSPGSFLEQLIVNFEALYVPNRTFTDPSLRQAFVEKGEVTAALVVEKYQRFSTEFPATYLVAQGIYKSHSDLFGRYLGGMGGDASKESPGIGGGYKAIALALQQPFPNLIWRADLALLYDLQGGVFIQPTLKWKPNGAITIDAFYNYLNGQLGNKNENIVGTLDFADEVGMRIAYQF
ncbi:DUF1302 family protein [Nevskia sp.]|uniref:DUF1302 family protein n=1 Tax=Nevskia sp. TaxID=1929292 RepID=UPI003457DB5E